MKKSLLLIMIFVIILALVGCEAPEAPEVTDISYDGEYITWKCDTQEDMVFEVKINDGEVKNVTGRSYKYDAKKDDFSVEIVTVNKSNKAQSNAVAKNFSYIGSVEGVAMNEILENGQSTWEYALEWTDLEQADSYTVKFKSTSGSVSTYECDSNSFRDFPVGEYTVYVKPNKTEGDTAYYGVYSDSVVVNILDAPQNIAYDNVKGTLSWEGNGASKYYLEIDGVGEIISGTSKKTNYFPNESFNVRVKAISDRNNTYPSKYSDVKKFTFLQPITTLNVVDGVLVWDPVPNAEGYMIRLDNVLQTTVLSQAKYELPKLEQRVSVLPILTQGDYFSSWTLEQSYNILPTPKASMYSGTFGWEAVDNASGYEVRLYKDGTFVAPYDAGSKLDYKDLTFDEVGLYELKVVAKSATQDYYNSRPSQSVTVRRLDKPSGYELYDNPYKADVATLTFDAVSNAKGYQVKIDGADYGNKLTSNTPIALANALNDSHEEHSFVIQIFAKGNEEATGDNVVLDSLDCLTTTITRLAAPQNVKILENRIIFDDVSSALDGYVLYLDGEGPNNGKDIVSSDSIIGLNMTPGEHRLAIKTKGNVARNTISSALSRNNEGMPFVFWKLKTPTTSIREEKLIVDNKDDKATQFNIYKDETTSIGTYESMFSLSEYVVDTQQGTSFHVQAIGNGSDIISSDISAKVVARRLPSPENYRLTDADITWDRVAGAAGYKLYNNAIEIAEPTSNIYLTENLPAGDYSLSVVAVGNGSGLFSSNYTVAKNFTKLSSPVVSRDGANYSWNKITGATGYKVRYDSKPENTLSANTVTYPAYFDAIGTRMAWFRAMGDGITTVSSNYTKIEQTVAQITVPEISVAKVDGKIKVTVDNASTYDGYGIKYEFYNNNSPTASDLSTCEYALGEGTYRLKVKAVASKFVGDTYYLDAESAVKTCTILGRTTGVVVAKDPSTGVYSLKWNTVSNATKYYAQIKCYNGDTLIDTITKDSCMINKAELGLLTNVTKIEYTIVALSNGESNVYDGESATGTLNINY